MRIVAVLAILALVFVGVYNLPPPKYTKQSSYVLTVVATKFNGSPIDAVSMQEFSTKLNCEYALGFVKGITDTTAECMPK